MTKITNVVVIILSILLLASCGATVDATKKNTASPCPKILLPPMPQEEHPPPNPTVIPPGGDFRAKNISVAMPRATWTLMELYNKSLKVWMSSAQEAVDKHNQFVDKQLDILKEESSKPRGWFW